MTWRWPALVAAALAALAAPANAPAALFFVFDRPAAAPNDRVTVRIGGTPRQFTPITPLRRPVHVYIVRRDLAASVRSRFDRRLAFITAIRPDRNLHAVATFSVPPLDPAEYTLAYWCPACAASSRGRTFFVQDPATFAARIRAQALLRIATTEPCPVTLPNGNRPPGQPRGPSWYGNGLLWAGLYANGVYAAPPEQVGADGSIFDKLLWATAPPWLAPTLVGRRLDAAAPPLRVLRVNRGSFSGIATPSFMTPVLFPSPGCWRLTARVGDVSLTYVIRVVLS